jgi:hypothetical protein
MNILHLSQDYSLKLASNMQFIQKRYQNLKRTRDNIAKTMPDIHIYNMCCVFHCISSGRRKDNFYFEVGYPSCHVQFTVTFREDTCETMMIFPFVVKDKKKVLVTNFKEEVIQLFCKPNESELMRNFFSPLLWQSPKLQYFCKFFPRNDDFVSYRLETMKTALEVVSKMIPKAIVYNPSFYQYKNPAGEKEDNFHFEVAYPSNIVQVTVSFQSRSVKYLKLSPFININGEKLQLRDSFGNCVKQFVSIDDVNVFVKLVLGHWEKDHCEKSLN